MKTLSQLMSLSISLVEGACHWLAGCLSHPYTKGRGRAHPLVEDLDQGATYVEGDQSHPTNAVAQILLLFRPLLALGRAVSAHVFSSIQEGIRRNPSDD